MFQVTHVATKNNSSTSKKHFLEKWAALQAKAEAGLFAYFHHCPRWKQSHLNKSAKKPYSKQTANHKPCALLRMTRSSSTSRVQRVEKSLPICCALNRGQCNSANKIREQPGRARGFVCAHRGAAWLFCWNESGAMQDLTIPQERLSPKRACNHLDPSVDCRAFPFVGLHTTYIDLKTR